MILPDAKPVIILKVLAVLWASDTPVTASSVHHTLFVTLPTPTDAEMTVHPTHDLQEDQDFPTEAPDMSSVPWDAPSESRSALLRIPTKDTKMVFLADDHEAASRIPELLTTLSERAGSFEDSQLFPNTRSGPLSAATTTERDLRTTIDTIRTLSRTDESSIDVGSESRLESKMGGSRSNPEIGSRHSTAIYRPDHYRPLPPRQPPMRNYKPSSGLQGASVIDKEDIFANNIYSGGPGSFKRPHRNLTRVTHIEAECQDDFMRIHVQFNGSFSGLVYSSGYAYDGDCIYVNGSGRGTYDFFIQLNRCGTLSGNEKGREDIRGRTPSKNMMWNTLTVQYNPLIEEEWDEHFKVTCEYGYDFWKTVTFPFLDVEVQTGNPVVFTLTPPECHMEIRYGYGTAGTRVAGPVRVGDPLTLVIYMRSEFEGFDIVVSDCYAHNGGNKRIALIDHYGCPVDEKLISHFEGSWTADGVYETQVYAFMKTFRFTGSPALYIECDVRMCHGDCPTQPCHWRRGKVQKRSVHSDDVNNTKPANISESLSLFQALQVIRDDQALHGTQRDLRTNDVCLKKGTFSALAAMVAVVVGISTAVCGVLCLRIRRAKKQEDTPAPRTPYISTYRSDFVPPTKRRLE
ncbi:uncharacterized protein LOC122264663 [Penaeus japonicus]|uniref:uncharacterized protein LOC122264663 n=1 Tax=Penaeus japonicus TaxID=27405 RepID=UPI001C70DD5F|nr:uncharacterized protein LOC122264663 [Penaeus japonicus]